MINESNLGSARRLADRFTITGAVFCAASASLAILAVFVPVHSEASLPPPGAARHMPATSRRSVDTAVLAAKMAGRRLIRPPQVQAAVKDSGAAGRLVKRLQLQGVVQMGGDLIAYIQVEKEGVKAVRQGQKILDFTVQKIEQGNVVLSLEGVEIGLSH